MKTTSLFGMAIVTWASTMFIAGASAQQTRLREAVRFGDESKVFMAESVRPQARPEHDSGRMNADRVLSGITLYFRRSEAQQADLDQLLLDQQNPGSASFHKWLTPQQFADRFAMNGHDLDKIAQWLASQGFVVDPIAPSRDHISFSGSVAQVESAFQTEMHFFDIQGDRHFANATELALPHSVASLVQTVNNLHDFRPKPKSIVRHGVSGHRISSHLTSNVSGNTFIAPDDFATLYGVKALYAANFTGAGRKIAIAGQTQIDTTNIDAFRKAAGLPANDPSIVLVPNTGAPQVSTPDLDEAYLDTEWAGGIAKDANIVYVYTGANKNFGAFDSVFYAVDNNLAPVISLSYGDCEANIGNPEATTFQQKAQKANALGITIVVASGDQGAADCEGSKATVATKGLGVDIPAAIPEITGVGGTSFSADLNASTQYWTVTNDASTQGSARSYIGESSWNDTKSGSVLSASGGGASTFFTKPSWQVAPGVPAGNHRFVPDISLDASPNHDGYLICAQGSCVNGFRRADLTFNAVGGTSVSAPAFAAIMTLAEQASSLSGLGNVNTKLYPIANAGQNVYGSVFHDITSGNNNVTCSSGPGCPAGGGSIGFPAGPGYDQVTGLGSIDAFNLQQAIAGMFGKTLSTVTVTTLAASTSSPLPGGVVSFTATVTPTASSSSTPTGSVRFMVDGSYVNPPIALVGGQAVFTTTFPEAGYHSVTASYFGDSNFSGATSAAFSLLVQGPLQGTFSMAAYPSAVTISSTSTTQTSVIALTGAAYNGPIGLSCSVAFAGSGSPGLLPACSLADSSLTLSFAQEARSTTLTMSATGTIAQATPLVPKHNSLEWWTIAGTASFGCTLLLCAPTQRRRGLGMMLLACAAIGAGCGGSGGSSTSTTPTPGSQHLSRGTYNVVVTATPQSGAAQTTTVTLTVQ